MEETLKKIQRILELQTIVLMCINRASMGKLPDDFQEYYMEVMQEVGDEIGDL